MHPLGFLRISSVSTKTSVANPMQNALSMIAMAKHLTSSDVIVFPELSITGYTCGDLFSQDRLLNESLVALESLTDASSDKQQLWVVGMPLRVGTNLYNTAAILHNGSVLGVVPKQYLPTYQEFYESRWFHPGSNCIDLEVELFQGITVPFGIDLLFQCGHAVVGVEICEDLWMPVPPSSIQALAGANVLLNLSASNETIGKASYRKSLVASQSGRCIAAYAYSSSGPTESTTDVVFGGHCIIAETGSILCESSRVGDGWGDFLTAEKSTSQSGNSDQKSADKPKAVKPEQTSTPDGHAITVDIDLQRINHDRQIYGTFSQGLERLASFPFRTISFSLEQEPRTLHRHVSGQPFVPSNNTELGERCREIFEIQQAALAQRVAQLPNHTPLVIGVSGGLDSTLALIVAVTMCDREGIARDRIRGITMPGFGTSSRTLNNAQQLMRLLGISFEQIDIRDNAMNVFRDLEHQPFGISVEGKTVEAFQKEIESLPQEHHNDLTFENVQARVRTLLLMSRGFVLGTGDLSEAALGWSTYNADHMSMYNVNCSIPKTLVRFLVRYVADHYFQKPITDVLHSIADTPISPELLPLSRTGEIQQATESTVGSYELQDFFLYHFIRTGASPEKIVYLAEHANFQQSYDHDTICRTLKIFVKRFFANQFKRSCVPDGPKVGTVSLSPRGDWRMPSDASSLAWLQSIDHIKKT